MENSMPIYSVNEYYGINGDTPGKQDSSPTTILSRQFDGGMVQACVGQKLVKRDI